MRFISQFLLVAHLPDTTLWLRRWASCTAPPVLAASVLFEDLPLPISTWSHPGWQEGQSQATSGLCQVTNYLDSHPLLSVQARASRLHSETWQLLLPAGLLIHLEFPVSFPATSLKLPGKLLWLKNQQQHPSYVCSCMNVNWLSLLLEYFHHWEKHN